MAFAAVYVFMIFAAAIVVRLGRRGPQAAALGFIPAGLIAGITATAVAFCVGMVLGLPFEPVLLLTGLMNFALVITLGTWLASRLNKGAFSAGSGSGDGEQMAGPSDEGGI